MRFIRARLFEDTLRLTVRTRLNFVSVSFGFTDVLLLVFTGGNRIIKRGFHLFRRTSGLEVNVQQGNPHVIRANGFFQFALGIATNNGTAFGQNTIHGVFADDATQRAVRCLTQAVIGAGNAKQIALRIGNAILHVHFNAHDVFIRRQHHARCRQFTHGFHVYWRHFIDKVRFPVQTRFNQMAELAQTGHHATFGFFNGVEPGCSPDNNDRCGNDTHNTPARLTAWARRTRITAAGAFTTAQATKFFTQFTENIIQIRWPLIATAFVSISLRVAAWFAASPRVAVLSVVTGLIPRHVCAPYLFAVYTRPLAGTPKGEKSSGCRSNDVLFECRFLFTESTPVNDRHTHLHTYAAIVFHPLFFYCLKLVKPTSQTPFLRR